MLREVVNTDYWEYRANLIESIVLIDRMNTTFRSLFANKMALSNIIGSFTGDEFRNREIYAKTEAGVVAGIWNHGNIYLLLSKTTPTDVYLLGIEQNQELDIAIDSENKEFFYTLPKDILIKVARREVW